MAHFMVDIALPADPTEEFISLIPRQRAQVEKLLEQGTVVSYSLSLDRTRLWIILHAKHQREAMEILATFPMFPWFDVSLHPLMFHNTSMIPLLKVSMN